MWLTQSLNPLVQLLDFPRIPEWHNTLIQSLQPVNAAKVDIEKGDKLDAVLGHLRVYPTITVRQGPLMNCTLVPHLSFHVQPNQT